MLIDLSKSEFKKIEYYLLGDTDPLVVSILEKIRNLDNVCECGGKTNENSIWDYPLLNKEFSFQLFL